MDAGYTVTLCTRHKCKDLYCKGLHICHYYLTKTCTNGDFCSGSHSLNDEHNSKVLTEAGCPDSTIQQLKHAYFTTKSQSPTICTYYNNVREGCSRSNSCHFLHICLHYVLGDCQYGKLCQLSHSILDKQPQICLAKYGISLKCLGEEVEIVDMLRKYAGYSVVLNMEKYHEDCQDGKQEESLIKEVNNNIKIRNNELDSTAEQRNDKEINNEPNMLDKVTDGCNNDDDLEEGEIRDDDDDDNDDNENNDDLATDSTEPTCTSNMVTHSNRTISNNIISSFESSETHTHVGSATPIPVKLSQRNSKYPSSPLLTNASVHNEVMAPHFPPTTAMIDSSQQNIAPFLSTNEIFYRTPATRATFYEHFSKHNNLQKLQNEPSYLNPSSSMDVLLNSSQLERIIPTLEATNALLTSKGIWPMSFIHPLTPETVPIREANLLLDHIINHTPSVINHTEPNVSQAAPFSCDNQLYNSMSQSTMLPNNPGSTVNFSDNNSEIHMIPANDYHNSNIQREFMSSGFQLQNEKHEQILENHKRNTINLNTCRTMCNDIEDYSLYTHDVDMRPIRQSCNVNDGNIIRTNKPPSRDLPYPPIISRYRSRSQRRKSREIRHAKENKKNHLSDQRSSSHQDRKCRRISDHHKKHRESKVEKKKKHGKEI